MPFSAGPRTVRTKRNVLYSQDTRLTVTFRFQCIGQQFALNSASYLLARLAQAVTAIDLVPSVGGSPPLDWATKSGRQAIEKCHPSVRVVTYAKVGEINTPAFEAC